MELENAARDEWHIFNQKHKKDVCIFHIALNRGMPIYTWVNTIWLSLNVYVTGSANMHSGSNVYSGSILSWIALEIDVIMGM